MNMLNILWNFAGSDKQILELCPRTDKAKNAALGFLILILAFITGASLIVALSFIFPASSDASITKKVFFYLFYVFVGCIWFMMVTNLYRLLISATGFGDGTVEITIDEVKNNIFKISASLVLSICVSVPITAALLHKEIINYKSPAFEEKINDEFVRIDKANILELSDLYQALASVDLKNTTSLDRVNEIKNQIDLKRQNIAHQKSQAVSKRQAEMEISLIGETKEAFSMHTILVTSIFLFLGVIFVLPIFLRMIWVKGCYEYLCEFQNNLVLAKYGIHPQVKIYKNDIEFIQKRYSIPNQILKNLIRKLEKDKNTHSKGLNKAHKAKTKNLKDEYSLS
jgi:hypothetical protein